VEGAALCPTVVPWIAAVVALALLLAAAPAAHAGWRSDRATAIARIVWHHPNVDRLQIRWGTPPADVSDAQGWTSGESTGEIWLNATRPLAWEPFCTIVLHEAGHLAGMGHTNRGVMHPQRFVHLSDDEGHERWDGTDPRCRARGRPYLAAHGLRDLQQTQGHLVAARVPLGPHGPAVTRRA
jgi:hypothetical protein